MVPALDPVGIFVFHTRQVAVFPKTDIINPLASAHISSTGISLQDSLKKYMIKRMTNARRLSNGNESECEKRIKTNENGNRV